MYTTPLRAKTTLVCHTPPLLTCKSTNLSRSLSQCNLILPKHTLRSLAPSQERTDDVGRSVITLQNPVSLQLGGTLPRVDLSWYRKFLSVLTPNREESGPKDAPVVLIIPSLSSSSHVSSTQKNTAPGWWENMVGPNRWIDTNKYRVITPNVLGKTLRLFLYSSQKKGSHFGLTSPASINPLTDKRYGRHFPQITTADQANMHKLLLGAISRGAF